MWISKQFGIPPIVFKSAPEAWLSLSDNSLPDINSTGPMQVSWGTPPITLYGQIPHLLAGPLVSDSLISNHNSEYPFLLIISPILPYPASANKTR